MDATPQLESAPCVPARYQPTPAEERELHLILQAEVMRDGLTAAHARFASQTEALNHLTDGLIEIRQAVEDMRQHPGPNARVELLAQIDKILFP